MLNNAVSRYVKKLHSVIFVLFKTTNQSTEMGEKHGLLGGGKYHTVH